MDPFMHGFLESIKDKKFTSVEVAHYLRTFGEDMLSLFGEALKGRAIVEEVLPSRVSPVMTLKDAKLHIEHFAVLDAFILNLTGETTYFYKQANKLWFK